MDERQRQEMWQHFREGSKDLLVLWKDRTQCGHVHKCMLENNLYADDEQENGSNDEVHDTDDDFQTWCILDELEPEQWQEAITRQSERREGGTQKFDNLMQDTCITIATDEASNVKRTMTDGVKTVEFPEVERIKMSWEVKMDGTRSKDLQQTLACTSKLMSHQEVKNTKATPVAISKWIDTKPVVEKEEMHVRSLFWCDSRSIIFLGICRFGEACFSR